MIRLPRPALSALAASGLLMAGPANAATQYWDPDLTPTDHEGKGSGGNGTWTSAGANWSDGTADAALVTTNIAGFGGAAGTVTLTSAVTIGGLQFDSSNYSIGSGATTGQINLFSQASSQGLTATAGVTGTSINVGSVKLGSTGSAVAIALTNTDLVNFNNTTVYLTGSRTTRITNSSTAATTTFQKYGLSDKPAPGYGTWPNTNTALDVGNLTLASTPTPEPPSSARGPSSSTDRLATAPSPWRRTHRSAARGRLAAESISTTARLLNSAPPTPSVRAAPSPSAASASPI